jgi:hypothetical protein
MGKPTPRILPKLKGKETVKDIVEKEKGKVNNDMGTEPFCDPAQGFRIWLCYS